MNWRSYFWLPIIPLFTIACALPFLLRWRAGALLVDLGGVRPAPVLCVCLATGIALFDGTQVAANWDSGQVPRFARVLAALTIPLFYLQLASVGRQVRQRGLLISGWLVRWKRVERWEWLGFSGDPTLMLIFSGRRGGMMNWRIPAAKRAEVDGVLRAHVAEERSSAHA